MQDGLTNKQKKSKRKTASKQAIQPNQNFLPFLDRDLDDPATTTNPFKAASTLPLSLALCLQLFLSR